MRPKSIYNILVLGISGLLLSSCYMESAIHSILPKQSVSAGPPILSVKNSALLAGSSAEMTVDPVSRTITLDRVPAGRMYSLVLREDNKPLGTLNDLSCNSGTWIENLLGSNVQFGRTSPSALHLDLSLRETDGTLNIECDSPIGGSFKVIVNYLGSSHSVISSSMSLAPGIVEGEYPVINVGGNIVVWIAESVGLGNKKQVIAKNRTTGDYYLVSSVDGTAGGMGNDLSWAASVSNDGRYVVFGSGATNLVQGATTAGVYLKDLTDITKPPILISSLDSLATDQTSFQANADCNYFTISGDGRYVFFSTAASNFSAGSATEQVYRKDLQNLSSAPVIVSSLDSTQANQTSYKATGGISEGGSASVDGRYYVFTASSSNLHGGGSSVQTYLKDMQNLNLPPTLISSLDSTQSNQTGLNDNDGSYYPEISQDGRYIIFTTGAPSFGVVGYNWQVFLKDRLNLNQRPVLISSLDSTQSDQTNFQGDSQNYNPKISADGKVITFHSFSTNLDAFDGQILIKYLDHLSSPPILASSKDSLQADQTLFRGSSESMNPAISPDGKYIVFVSAADNFGSESSRYKVTIKDLQHLDQTPSIILFKDLTDDLIGASDLGAFSPKVSEDGRYVFYLSYSDVCLTCGTFWQIYRKDMRNLQGTPVMVTSLDSTQADQTNFRSNGNISSNYAISKNGRYVVFSSNAANLSGGTAKSQVYIKDLDSPQLPPVIMSSKDSTQANQTSYKADGDCTQPSVSNDGRYVVFICLATNLVTGTTTTAQVYLKDRNSLAISPVLISSRDSMQANQTSYRANTGAVYPKISGNGQKVVFVSGSTNLVTGASNNQIYVKSVASLASLPVMVSSRDSSQANQTSYRGNSGSIQPEISDDGRYVAFYSSSTNFYTTVSGNHIYYKDLNSPAVSPLIVSSLNSTLSNQTGVVANSDATQCSISSDGRYVSFKTAATNLVTGISTTQVYRKDMLSGQASAPLIVTSRDSSMANQTGIASNGTNFTGQNLNDANISGNGEYFVYTSDSTNLVSVPFVTKVLIKRIAP